MIRVVASRRNALVRAYRDLAEHPDQTGTRLLLDGSHLVREAHQAALRFESVAVSAALLGTATEEGRLADELQRAGVEVFAVGAQVVTAISPVRAPTGMIAIVHHHPTTAAAILEQSRLFALVVIDVQDPGNVGALLRVAEAGGVTGAIVSGDSANPFSWKAVRGSMGSVLRLPVARSPSVDALWEEIRKADVKTVAAVPREGWDPDAVDWSGRIALLLGGEGAGLSVAIAAECDERVSVPMTPPVESLNVAAAGAILIYAARRARP